MCNWLSDRKCFGIKWKPEISNSILVFPLVPKNFQSDLPLNWLIWAKCVGKKNTYRGIFPSVKAESKSGKIYTYLRSTIVNSTHSYLQKLRRKLSLFRPSFMVWVWERLFSPPPPHHLHHSPMTIHTTIETHLFIWGKSFLSTLCYLISCLLLFPSLQFL